MVIGIDHGNMGIKTPNFVFTSGYEESENKPAMGTHILQYQNVYYTLTNKRFYYRKDKTTDEKFFVLTLFALGMELEKARVSGGNSVYFVQLALGLPPKHFGSLHEKFRDYFLQEFSQQVDFIYNTRSYSVCVKDVKVFPQAFAAAMLHYDVIINYPKLIILDLGGYTLDVLQMEKGVPNLSVCKSLEFGVIHFMNQLKELVESKFDLLLDDNDIQNILQKEKNIPFKDTTIKFVEKQAQVFINEIFTRLRELKIDILTAKIYWIGGGSALLKEFIETQPHSGEEVCIIEDVHANAKGYVELYKLQN